MNDDQPPSSEDADITMVGTNADTIDIDGEPLDIDDYMAMEVLPSDLGQGLRYL